MKQNMKLKKVYIGFWVVFTTLTKIFGYVLLCTHIAEEPFFVRIRQVGVVTILKTPNFYIMLLVLRS